MAFPELSTPQTRRLGLGLAASVVLHLAVLLGVAPEIPRFIEPQPLTVEIQSADVSGANELAARYEPEAAAAATAGAQGAAEAAPTVSTTPPEMRHAPVELPMAFDKYYTASELDQRAVQANDVQLVYPKDAYQMRIRGSVRLRLLISERGKIDGVSVVASEPAGVFEANALAAAHALEFTPAVKDGRKVKSQKLIEVVFDPYESINTP